jgi:lipopolysaccharide export system protein LptA
LIVKRLLFLILWLIIAISVVSGQEISRLEILNTDVLTLEKLDGKTLRKLTGNVILKQDTILFYCDSAIQFESENRIEAFSSVKIILNSGTRLFADKLKYEGNTRIAELYDNIRLEDGINLLTTNRLNYNRDLKTGSYFEGGILKDTANTLKSKEGIYNTENDQSLFKKDVVLTGKDFTLYCDSLLYNTHFRIATLISPSRIETESETLYAKSGFYDDIRMESKLYGRPELVDTAYHLFADSIHYFRQTQSGTASGNILLVHKDSTRMVQGNFSEFNKKEGWVYLYESCKARQINAQDTYWIFTDTLFATDSLHEAGEGLRAWPDVRIIGRQLQARADSLAYLTADSSLTLFHSPIVWSDIHQLTGDTIRMWQKNNSIDSLVVLGNSFAVSKEDSVGFNQMKGKFLYAKFIDNEIRKLFVRGNAEVIYFTKNDKKKNIAVNKSFGTEFIVHFNNRNPEKIIYLNKPEGTVLPFHKTIDMDLQLEGFRWLEEKRPQIVNENQEWF